MIIITNPPEKFCGEIAVSGDKSITHRALMIGAMAGGVTEITGYLDAEDCLSTMRCLQKLGTKINARGSKLVIEGRNMVFKEPAETLNTGNSGTTTRLLMGILSGQSFSATLTGDQSLQRRPMKRVVEPLRSMGAVIEGERDGDSLPLTVQGGDLKAVYYHSPKASAQVKSAVLFAGLYADGLTTVEEPYPSRNHSELMLKSFDAAIESRGCKVSIEGQQQLKGCQVKVPGDISAAAFFMVAAAIVPESDLLLKDVGINPTRSGVIEVLASMGAEIELINKRTWSLEPVADIRVRGGNKLNGISIGGSLVPRLIDEIPVLAVAAALAEGETDISEASELRVKESDRISELSSQLQKLGVNITEKDDGMIIKGGARLRGAEVDSCGDHRIAMALAVAGLAASGETVVHNAGVISISFPGFMPAMRSLIV
ncbi:MAG: 3-phosphoshikimate 1-carboxyvinyltransferase [Bacillota bacterium]